MTIQQLYNQWCKETKRTGSVLVGGSIREFFEWVDEEGYYLRKEVQFSDSFQKSMQSIEDGLRRNK